MKDLPNVITPNGDMYNEYFTIDSETIKNIKLQIVNRWGKQVYYSNSYKNNWNGGDLSSGVYFYTVSGSCIMDIKGAINILKWIDQTTDW